MGRIHWQLKGKGWIAVLIRLAGACLICINTVIQCRPFELVPEYLVMAETPKNLGSFRATRRETRLARPVYRTSEVLINNLVRLGLTPEDHDQSHALALKDQKQHPPDAGLIMLNVTKSFFPHLNQKAGPWTWYQPVPNCPTLHRLLRRHHSWTRVRSSQNEKRF